MEVKVCVNCFSQDTSIDFAGAMFGIYADKCQECGFIGIMMLMDKKDADKLMEEKPPVPREPDPINRPESNSLSTHYCSECMRLVEGKKTLFGNVKCEYCRTKLNL